MTPFIQSAILSGDVCYELLQLGPIGGGFTDFQLMLFSQRFQTANLAFEYRCEISSAWRTDAALVLDTAATRSGNVLIGLPCCPAGSIQQFRWNYQANGLMAGQQVEIRLIILPSLRLLSYSGYLSASEAVYAGNFRNLEPTSPNQVVGIANAGELLCVTSDSFFVVNATGNILTTVDSLSNPVCAQQLRNGHYLILEAGANRIREVNAAGSDVRTPYVNGDFDNPTYFVYDELTQNLLVSGNATTVYEISWTAVLADYGQVLWSSGGFTTPQGLAYARCNNEFVFYVANYGANTVVGYDHLTKAVIQTITEAIIDGVTVDLNGPYRVAVDGNGNVMIAEYVGLPANFSPNVNAHPALVRAGIGHPETPNQDSLPIYQNLLFAPIVRDTVIVSSSSSSSSDSSSSSNSSSSSST